MSRPSLVVLVVEDDHQSMLIRRSLINCGLQRHEIRVEQAPSGGGSAEAWVRSVFVRYVSAYRIREAKAQSALIVVIDADTHSSHQRLRHLDDALASQGRSPIAGQERVARLIPKRNIETWILCLNGHGVDEGSDYKNRNEDWSALIRMAAATLCEWTRADSEPPDHCIESLRHGVGELRRLDLRR